MAQEIIIGLNSYKKTNFLIDKLDIQKYMLVCGQSIKNLPIWDELQKRYHLCIVFDKFSSNPTYESVLDGVRVFKENGCEALIAVGGGSAIDVAKCIKLFAPMKEGINYLNQQWKDSSIPLISIPTTAGTGSESTKFSVIYHDGEKQSISHNTLIPDYVILDHGSLSYLPIYQKKCTVLDALCQSIESMWCVNSTNESKIYARESIILIMKNLKKYLDNDIFASQEIMKASNLSGRAINITQTTAAHAMSYKMTSLYGLPHGHSVAICLPKLWEFMIKNTNMCKDIRGEEYIIKTFEEISRLLGGEITIQGISIFSDMLADMEILSPRNAVIDDICILAHSVNMERLNNNPINLRSSDIEELYLSIIFN